MIDRYTKSNYYADIDKERVEILSSIIKHWLILIVFHSILNSIQIKLKIENIIFNTVSCIL